jgi:hypothetical protein
VGQHLQRDIGDIAAVRRHAAEHHGFAMRDYSATIASHPWPEVVSVAMDASRMGPEKTLVLTLWDAAAQRSAWLPMQAEMATAMHYNFLLCLCNAKFKRSHSLHYQVLSQYNAIIKQFKTPTVCIITFYNVSARWPFIGFVAGLE